MFSIPHVIFVGASGGVTVNELVEYDADSTRTCAPLKVGFLISNAYVLFIGRLSIKIRSTLIGVLNVYVVIALIFDINMSAVGTTG
jgi:hypothetical protein